MAGNLISDAISLEECRELRNVGEGDALKNYTRKLTAKRLMEHLPEAEAREQLADIVSDMLVNASLFCADEGFSDEKTGATLSILWRLFLRSTTTSASLKESLTLLQTMLVEHSVHRPPVSVLLFNLGDVKAVHHYITTTFHRHYKLYQCCFAAPQRAVVRASEACVRVPQPPSEVRPLCQAKELNTDPEENEVDEGINDAQEATEDAVEEKDVNGESAINAEDDVKADGAPSAEEGGGAASGARADIVTENVAALPQPQGLKRQLEQIVEGVSVVSEEKLAMLEAKVSELEAKQQELREKNSKGKKK